MEVSETGEKPKLSGLSKDKVVVEMRIVLDYRSPGVCTALNSGNV